MKNFLQTLYQSSIICLIIGALCSDANAQCNITACASNITINTTPGQCTGSTVLLPPTISGACSGVNGNIVGVSSPADGLNLIQIYSPITWAVVSSQPFTLAGFTLVGANAITWNSDNYKFYAIVRPNFGARRLVTVDPSTGICTDIGPMASNFSTLTYSHASGLLYTMGGTGSGSFAEKLYSVNMTTAATTFLAGPYSLGGEGEVIAYNHDDGYIYHWSGLIPANMEKIHPTTFIATPIFQSGVSHSEVFGAVYQGNGRFLVTTGSKIGFTISTTGVVALQASGLTFAPRGLGIPLETPVNNAPLNYPIGNTTVTWTAKDQNGNVASCNQIVTVVDNEVPTLTSPGNQVMSPAAITCTADYTIASPISDNCTNSFWGYSTSGATTLTSGGNALAAGTGSGVLTFNAGTTQVTLTGIDASSNNATSVTFNVYVGSIDVTPNSALICNPGGTAVTLTASGGINYAWAPITGLSGISGSIAIASPTATTTYTVTYTDANGCSTTSTATINVSSVITDLTASTSPAILCEGGTLNLSVSASLALNTYSWSGPNSFSSTSQNPSIPNIDALVNGIYTITASTNDGCIAETTTTVLLSPNPDPMISGLLALCDGGSTVLDAGAFNTYDWSTGASTQTVSVNAAGSYSVTVTNSAGCSNSSSVDVSMQPAISVNASGTDITCYSANDGTASVLTSGDVYALGYNGYYPFITQVISHYSYDNGVLIFDPSYTTGPTQGSDTYFGLDQAPGGQVYVIKSDASFNRNLYTLDLSNGSMLDHGSLYSTTGSNLVQDFCFDNVGVMYAVFNGGKINVINYQAPGLTPTLLNITPSLPNNGGVGLTYDDEHHRLIYATGTLFNPNMIEIYGIDLSTGTSSLITTVTSGAITAQGIEYIGNNTVISTGTNGSNVIGTIDLATGLFTSLTPPPIGTQTYTDIKDLLFVKKYTYSWAPSGGNASSASGLAPNTYTVTVTDEIGCTATSSVVITEPSAITISSTVGMINCVGETTSIEIMASGGIGALSGTGVFTNIGPGTYTFTVTDANNCTASSIITPVNNANPIPNPIISGALAICDGGSTILDAGTFETYDWSTGASTQTVSVNATGSYSVTVTNSAGCSNSSSVNVLISPTISASATGTDISCHAANDGTASVLASGDVYALGFSGYYPSITQVISHYSYDNGVLIFDPSYTTGPTQGSDTYFGLDQAPGGQVYVIKSDASFNRNLYTLDLSNGSMLDNGSLYSTTGSNLVQDFCFDNVGVMYAVFNGGKINVINYQVPGLTPTLLNITPSLPNNGGVGLTYDDEHHRLIYATGTLFNPNMIEIYGIDLSTGTSHLITTVTSGAITAQGIEYIGNNTVISTGTNGSNVIGTIDLATGLFTSLTPPPIGTQTYIDIKDLLFVKKYTYSWAPSGGNASSASGLAPNTYTVTVTDEIGCTATSSVVITEPSAINISSTVGMINCVGETTSIEIMASGGTGALGGTGVFTNIGPGTYTFTVTDANNCTASTIITPVNNANPIPNPIISGALVFCDGGSTILDAGTFDTYDWSTGANTQTVSVNAAGIYSVTVTNSAGCSNSSSVNVLISPTISASVTGTDISCHAANDGTASVLASGGFVGNVYALGAGGYYPSITQAISHYSYDNGVLVYDPTYTSGPTSEVDTTYFGLDQTPGGQAYLIKGASNARNMYSLDLNTGTLLYVGLINSTSNNKKVQDFSFDANGNMYAVFQGGIINTIDYVNPGLTPTVFNVAPSLPDYGGVGLTYDYDNNRLIYATGTLFNPNMIEIYGIDLLTGTSSLITTVTSGAITAQGIEYIGNNTVISTGTNGSNVIGTIDLATGLFTSLTPPPIGTQTYTDIKDLLFVKKYTYSWAPSGGNASSASGLAPNTYTVTVTDEIGCTATSSVVITEPSAITISSTVGMINCVGETTSIEIMASGGTGALGGTGVFTNIGPGTYTFTVTDANNCTASSIITPVNNANPIPNPIISGALVFCDGGSTILDAGTFDTYDWSTGANTQTVSVNAAGIYSVTVTNSAGCSNSSSVNVLISPTISASVTGTDISCHAANDGTASVLASGGFVGNVYALGAGGYYPSITQAISHYSYDNGVLVYDPTYTSGPTSEVDTTYFGLDQHPGGQAYLIKGSTNARNMYSLDLNTGTLLYVGLINSTSNNKKVQDFSFDANGNMYAVFQGGIINTIDYVNPGLTPTVFNVAPSLPDYGGVGLTYDYDNNCLIYATGTLFNPNMIEIYGIDLATGTSSLITTVTSGANTAQGIEYIGNNTVISTGTDGSNVIGTIDLTTAIFTSLTPPPIGTQTYSSIKDLLFVKTYSYSWAPSGGNASIASGLSPDTYTVTVTDRIGCTATSSIVIAEPSIITVTATPQSSICNGHTTTIDVTASGGTGALSGTGSFTNIGAGTYTFTVTDDNSCTGSTVITLVNDPAPNPFISGSLILCDGGSTILDAGMHSGYLWSTAETTPSIQVNTAGIYSVTVTNMEGCTASAFVEVTLQHPLSVAAIINNLGCNGANGVAMSMGNGGLSAGNTDHVYALGISSSAYPGITNAISRYTYLNGALSYDPTYSSGPPADQYFALDQHPGGQPYVIKQETTSLLRNLFSIDLGTGSLNDLGAIYSSTGNNLVQDFCFDASGNMYASFNGGIINKINYQSASLTPTAFPISPTLPLSGGGVGLTYDYDNNRLIYAMGSLIPMGGLIKIYGINLTTGASTLLTTLSSGAFTAQGIEYVGNNTLLSSGTSASDMIGTINLATGIFTNLTPSGTQTYTSIKDILFVKGYTYAWSPTGGNAPIASGLAPDTYTVTVADARGCTATSSISLPNTLAVSISGTNITCNSINDGTATATAINGLSTGNTNHLYALGITSSAYPGISNAISRYTYNNGVLSYDPSYVSGLPSDLYFALDQHPGGQVFTIKQESISLLRNLYSLDLSNGNLIDRGSIYSTTGNNNVQDFCFDAAGNMYAAFNGGIINKINYLSQALIPTAFTVAPSLPNSGGVGLTYDYDNNRLIYASGSLLISPNNIKIYGINLANGARTLITTVTTGAFTGQGIEYIGNNTLLSTGTGASDMIGTIDLATGIFTDLTLTGTQTYTSIKDLMFAKGYNYSWSPSGGSNFSASGLAPDTYTVTVSDASGCTATSSINITEPSSIIVSANYLPIVGNGTTTVTVSATGGSGNYISGTGTFSGISSGNYTYTVIDDNGCEGSLALTVSGPCAPDLIAPTITCPGNISQANEIGLCSAVVTYTVTASDNCSVQSLVQTEGLASGSTFPLGVTTNKYIVTDVNGLKDSCTFTVTINAINLIKPSFSGVAPICSGDPLAPLPTTSSNSITGTWLPVLNPTATTTYTFTPTAGQCADTAMLTIVVKPTYTITASAGSNGSIAPLGNTILCEGLSQTYTITANPLYLIDDVLVDGVSQGSIAAYSFSNVTSNHTIQANFKLACSNVSYTYTHYICDGYFISFNGNTLTVTGVYYDTIPLPNGCDSFITLHYIYKYPSSSLTNLSICSNQLPYSWNGLVFNGPGVQTYHFSNAVGCDSAASLNLSVVNGTHTTVSQIACNKYIWQGSTYTASGTYHRYSTGSNGCPDTATLLLTINYSNNTTVTQAVCNNYTWFGTTYTSSGTYYRYTTGATGCPDTATLLLTILPGNNTLITQSACNQYTWYGTTYTNSGTYYHYTTSVTGCIDTTSLVLTINYSNNTTIPQSACNQFTWFGNTYTNSGTYYHYTIGSTGCADTTTLLLTNNVSTTGHTYQSICSGSSIMFNGQSINSSGMYYDTLTNVMNCDSFLTLHLTVTSGILLSAKALLCGPYNSSLMLMHDSLRVLGLLPHSEPYTSPPFNYTAIGDAGGDTIGTGVLNVLGANAIVDWVLLEIRSASSPSTILANKRALIQRDGDIVSSVDGQSPVLFGTMMAGNYYVSVKHRNHMGIMTNTAFALTGCGGGNSIDFTTAAPLYQNVMITANAPRKNVNGKYVMWPGDANSNKSVRYNGNLNDKDHIATAIGGATSLNAYNLLTYRVEDVNMDGKIRYNGLDHDRGVILNNVGVNTPNTVLSQHTPN